MAEKYKAGSLPVYEGSLGACILRATRWKRNSTAASSARLADLHSAGVPKAPWGIGPTIDAR